MKKKQIVPALLLVLATFGLSYTNGSLYDSRPNLDDTFIDKVDRLFAPWSKGDSPGAAVIVIKDSQILLKKGYGLANLENKKPIEPDTAFLLASITKQFTAMAIMMLAERGNLRYENPLSKYFPEFPPYARQITIRHLLNHMAGFPEYDELFLESGKLDKDYPRSAKTKPSSFEPTAKDALAILAQVKAPRFAAGEKWEYSNSGYVILAQIVEKVSGQSFSQFLQQNIFTPLGMKRSLLYDETRPKIQNVATSYTLKDGVYKDIDYTPQNAIYGEDNIYTTVEDMYKWDQALYTEKLVKAVTLKEAFTAGRLNNGESAEYGFGWNVRKFFGLNTVAHSGSWIGFRTYIVRFPDQHFTVVVLANLAELGVRDFANKISKIYLGDKMTLPVAIQLASEVMLKYVGKYEMAPGFIAEVSLEKNHLWIKTPDGTRWKLLPESEAKFFLEGREEMSLIFNKDEKGNVISIFSSSITARKL